MYYVYLIQSQKSKMFYIGSTGDLDKRLVEHNNKQTKSTSLYTPWKLVYYEAFLSEKDARKREKALKHHGKGIAELKKRLDNSIIKINN
ncbi:GIY-YIG nuclease family protein [bacterium]|nr:GIY-YIG nuclease family protein [bacterium]